MNAPIGGANLLDDISVTLSVELGRKQMPLKDILSLGPESVVALDRLTDEPLDVLVNGRVIAQAEVVAQEGKFALRIIQLAGQTGTPSEAALANEEAA